MGACRSPCTAEGHDKENLQPSQTKLVNGALNSGDSLTIQGSPCGGGAGWVGVVSLSLTSAGTINV